MCPGRLLFGRDRFVGKKGMEGAVCSMQYAGKAGDREAGKKVRSAQGAVRRKDRNGKKSKLSG
jgi:hypothetical protein